MASPTWKPTAVQLRAAAVVARLSPVPIDQLPYTPDFEPIYEYMVERVGRLSRDQAWRCLLGARKRGWVGSSRREKHDGN